MQARLAATEAKERKIFGYSKTDVARSEAEAADIRRTEFASLAQSKMGKHAQLDELTARVEKEQASAMEVRGRLEASMSDEQAHLIEWEKVPTLRRCTRAASRSIAHARSRSLPPPSFYPRRQVDAQLQEAELEKASLVAAKSKAKELALERAQVAEASLDELKERYRDLRRREEKMLRAVREAEKLGVEQSRSLDLQAEALRRERTMWKDYITAADKDRHALFAESQLVEQTCCKEKAKQSEAQAGAARYRELVTKYN